MNFNSHLELTNKHAFLSPSSSHWVNYDLEKLDSVYLRAQGVRRGTELHALACELIRLGVKLPKTNKSFDRYVNDAIGFRMQPEQILYYSLNAFGTADAISFRKNFLRIHDLKTGVTLASMRQLYVYTALFCLEYSVEPISISIELRKYQNDEITVEVPDPSEIKYIMDKIVTFDKRIFDLEREAE